jgi:hypothetical protein
MVRFVSPYGGGVAVKRLLGVAVFVAALAMPASPAVAQLGSLDLIVLDTPWFLKAKGPGFTVDMTKSELEVRINDAKFGIPEAGFEIQRGASNIPPAARPIVCDNGTYRFVSAVFNTTQRGSSTEPRPAPYTPTFNARFPNIFTFVGTIDGVVQNEAGEQFRLLMSDLAHEEMTKRSFASTNPIHAFIVDAKGKVRDRASLVGRVNIDRKSGRSFHWILDRGTCHQTANLNLGPGTDAAVVFGPFFVLPFNSTVVRLPF